MFIDDREMINSLIEDIFEREVPPVHEDGWVDVGDVFTNDDINMLTETDSNLDHSPDLEKYM